MSCLLLHGPGAREEALKRAETLGQLLVPPVGDEGLKAEEAREVADLLDSPPVGDRLGIVIVGPLDGVRYATDILLKSLEECDTRVVLPLFWARDLSEVSPTIRSRCHHEWCPNGPAPEIEYVEAARNLWDSLKDKDVVAAVKIVKEHKGKEAALMGSLSFVLREHLTSPLALDVWTKIRTGVREPTQMETVSFCLKAMGY